MMPVPISAQTAADLDILRDESLSLVNQERSDRGLQELALQDAANQAAADHAADVLERDFYGHVSPEGETVLDRYLDADGIESHVVLENLSHCKGCPVPADEDAIAEMHEGWMQSPEHRENILANGISYYGFGLAETQDGTRYGVQVFSGAGVPRGLESGTEAEPLGADEQAQLAATAINEAREEQEVAAIATDERVMIAADRIVSEVDLDEPDRVQQLDLASVLPAEIPWHQFQLIVGNCTGCGTMPTDADVRFFIGEWVQDQAYRDLILDAGFSHIGLRILADGEGRKMAVAILAG